MTLAAIIKEDHKAILDEDGDEVMYNPSGGSPITINAIPNAGQLITRATDEHRTVFAKAVISVSKIDVPLVTRNADTVDVPGFWIGKTAATVNLRVSAVTGDKTDPGSWLLGLD
jgi:hypothetical protein